jgi:hypothetical protein
MFKTSIIVLIYHCYKLSDHINICCLQLNSRYSVQHVQIEKLLQNENGLLIESFFFSRPPTFVDRLTVITSTIKHDNVDVKIYGLQHLSYLLQTEKELFQACNGEKDHVDPIIREVKYHF